LRSLGSEVPRSVRRATLERLAALPRPVALEYRALAQDRSALREMLADVAWGALDVLIVDLPPGTERLVDLADLVPDLAGVLAVTIPTAASEGSVRRSLDLASGLGLRILGVIQNMSSYICPDCGRAGSIFPGAAGAELASGFATAVLGSIPIDPLAATLAEHGDMGRVLSETAAGAELQAIAAVLFSSTAFLKGA